MNNYNCTACICLTCKMRRKLINCCLIHDDLRCPGKVCLDYERDENIPVKEEANEI